MEGWGGGCQEMGKGSSNTVNSSYLHITLFNVTFSTQAKRIIRYKSCIVICM